MESQQVSLRLRWVIYDWMYQGVRILNFSAGRCYRWIFPHVGHWVSSSAAHYLFFCVDWSLYADSEIPLHLYPICYYIPIFRAHLLGVELLLVIALVYLIHSVFNLFVAHGVSIGSVHYGKKYRRQSESVQRTSKAPSGVIMVWSMEQTQTKARKDY